MNGLRKQFFTDAAFAVDQDIIRTGRKGHRQLFGLDHRAAAADNIIKGIARRKPECILHLFDLRRTRSRYFGNTTDFPRIVKQRIHIIGGQHVIIRTVSGFYFNFPVDDRLAIFQNVLSL